MDYTLLTGACGVLGGAFVNELALRGEPLYITGRSEERLQALFLRLKQDFPLLEVKYCACDLQSETSRARFFQAAEGERFKRLVYVAGADIQKGFEEYTEEKIILQTRANFEGAVSFTRFFLAHAAWDEKPEILAIGSVSGIYPMPYFALYSATKRALSHFFIALRSELKGRAKVTCVRPGAIPTREDVKAYIKTQGLWGRIAALSPETVAKRSLKAVKRNKKAPVLGAFNKIMHVLTAPVPLSWKLNFIGRKWSRSQKDAF